MLLCGNLIAENRKAERKKKNNGNGKATRKVKRKIKAEYSQNRGICRKSGIISETLNSRVLKFKTEFP